MPAFEEAFSTRLALTLRAGAPELAACPIVKSKSTVNEPPKANTRELFTAG